MRFPTPLLQGQLIRRYKRFLADIDLGGEIITAHVPNSGSMLGLTAPGSTVWLSHSDNPKRKLPYTLELIEADGGLVGVNTGQPNGLVADAVQAGKIPELANYAILRREVKYGRNSRIDILLESPDRPPAYVEIKSVTLRRPGLYNGHAAEFPDCVTSRGAKHLDELSEMVRSGARAVMLYLVQRTDCDHFRVAADLDPAYDAGLRQAVEVGVEVLCRACTISPQAIELDRPLPINL